MKRHSSFHFKMQLCQKTSIVLLQCLLFHHVQGNASPAIHTSFPNANTLRRFQLFQNYQNTYFTSTAGGQISKQPNQFHVPYTPTSYQFQGASASPIISSPSENVVKNIPATLADYSTPSPATTSSSFVLQPSQYPAQQQYFKQKSVSSNSHPVQSHLPQANLISYSPYPFSELSKQTTGDVKYSVQTKQEETLAKFLGILSPAVFQQVQDFPEKRFTYQFNTDSFIAPIHKQASTHYNSDPNPVNNEAISPYQQITKRIGNGGISNIVLFPTNPPTARSFQIPQNHPIQSTPLQQPQPNLPFNFPSPGPPGNPQGPNFPPFGPQGPPPELENGYNPNHLQAFPEPPYESEFANLPPLERMDAAELEEYLRRRASVINTNKPQARRSPTSSSTVIFPEDVENREDTRYRILNPTPNQSSTSSPSPLSGLPAEEAVRIASDKPIPRQCAYNTITQGSQGEDCIGVKKR